MLTEDEKNKIRDVYDSLSENIATERRVLVELKKQKFDFKDKYEDVKNYLRELLKLDIIKPSCIDKNVGEFVDIPYGPYIRVINGGRKKYKPKGLIRYPKRDTFSSYYNEDIQDDNDDDGPSSFDMREDLDVEKDDSDNDDFEVLNVPYEHDEEYSDDEEIITLPEDDFKDDIVKTINEKGIRFVEEKVSKGGIYKNETIKDRIKALKKQGINIEDKIVKLVPRNFFEKVNNSVIEFSGYRRYIVEETKSGKKILVPFSKRAKSKTKKVLFRNPDVLPPPIPRNRNSLVYKPGKRIFVSKFEKPLDAHLITSVETSTRNRVRKTLLQNILDIKELREKFNDNTIKILEEKLASNTNNKVLQKTKIIPYKTYVDNNYRKWYYVYRFSKIDENFKASSIEQDALKFVKDIKNPNFVVDKITKHLGENIFNENGIFLKSTLERVLQTSSVLDTLINEKSSYIGNSTYEFMLLTPLYVIMKNELDKHNKVFLQNIEGIEMARFVQTMVNYFMEHLSPDVESVRNQLRDSFVREYIEKHKDKDKEAKETFNKQIVGKLLDIYNKEHAEIVENNSRIKEYRELQNSIIKKIENDTNVRKRFKKYSFTCLDSIKVLSSKGIEIIEDVIKLEESMFQKHKSNQTYLDAYFKIQLLLDKSSIVGKHSEYYRRSIISGKFKISELNKISIYRSFPEIFINQNLNEGKYQEGLDMFETIISKSVSEFISVFIIGDLSNVRYDLISNKFASYIRKYKGKRVKSSVNLSGDIKQLRDYDCTDIKSKVDVSGRSRTKTVGKDCKAKMEYIPSDDVIILMCEDKFLSISENDVLHALADIKRGKTPINPYTYKPYDEEFLDRMKKRYKDVIQAEGFVDKYPHRVLEFKPTIEDIKRKATTSEITKPQTPKPKKSEPPLPSTKAELDSAIKHPELYTVLFFMNRAMHSDLRKTIRLSLSAKYIGKVYDQFDYQLLSKNIFSEKIENLFNELGIKKKYTYGNKNSTLVMYRKHDSKVITIDNISPKTNRQKIIKMIDDLDFKK